MKPERDDQRRAPRCLYEVTHDKAVLWIDDDSGKIVDELKIQSRIRPGHGGCELCHEDLANGDRLAEVEFDARGLPRLLFGKGSPVCVSCIEWVKLLHHYARSGSMSLPRFKPGEIVLRAATEELYEVLESRITGLATAGVWYPTYTCQGIEILEPSGEILSAHIGLQFELADCEIQPLPPRYKIAGHQRQEVTVPAIDLVGSTSRPVTAIRSDPRSQRRVLLPPRVQKLLPGKGGGS